MDYVISAGHTNSYSLVSGDTLRVLAGGESSGSIVDGGAHEYISKNGLSFEDTIRSGGLAVSAGGIADDTTISSGGVVSNYGLVSGAQVDAAGALAVYSGATESNSTLHFLGGEYVYSGGTAKGTTVTAAGAIAIDIGATAIDVTVDASAWGFIAGVVSKGQTFDDPAWNNSAAVTFNGMTVEQNGNLTLEGTTVQSGGTLALQSGAIADGIIILKGGELTGPGELGSSLYGVTSKYGVTSDYGLISGVALGGSANLFNAGTGEILVFAGGVADAVDMVGGTMEIESKGLASGVTVGVATTLEVDSGGVASAAGVTGLLNDYGSSVKAIISSGGSEAVFSRGVANATTVQSGAELSVVQGGVLIGGTVLQGGEVVGPGVLRGTLKDSGSASLLDVVAKAHLDVLSGGVATAAKIASGGTLMIASGGTADTPLVASGATVIDDGEVIFSNGATFAGALTGTGQVEVAAGTVVVSGTTQGFTGALVLSGGTTELAVSGLFGAGVTFAAGGAKETLELLTPAQPASGGTAAEVLSGFTGAADILDLAGLTFTKGATARVSGSTLTLKDGSYTAKFRLEGSSAAAYVVASDGHGGTEIHAKGAAAAAITQAAAGFTAGGAIGSHSDHLDHDRQQALMASIVRPRTPLL